MNPAIKEEHLRLVFQYLLNLQAEAVGLLDDPDVVDLAVDIVRRYLSLRRLQRQSLLHLALVAFWIANKWADDMVSARASFLVDACHVHLGGACCCNSRIFRALELDVLHTLDFRIDPTALMKN